MVIETDGSECSVQSEKQEGSDIVHTWERLQEKIHDHEMQLPEKEKGNEETGLGGKAQKEIMLRQSACCRGIKHEKELW